MLKFFTYIYLIFTLCFSAYALDYNGYRLNLDKQSYLKLNTFERAQYQKAIKLVEARQYRAAAGEFEKFQAQFDESSILPYVIFMKGYSLYMQKDRNKAIKAYNEVLDYFGEDIDAASKALFFLGKAYFDNGSKKKGMEVMQEMVEDKDYSQHPLAAGALRILAGNYWKNKEESEAVKYWKQVVKDFSKTNPREAGSARSAVTSYYIIKQQYKTLESWLIDQKPKDMSKAQHDMANYVWGVAWDGFHYNWRALGGGVYIGKFSAKEKMTEIKAFGQFFISKKIYFENNSDMWTYYTKLIRFLSSLDRDKKLLNSTINQTITFVNTIKDKKDADKKYSYLINILRDDGKFVQAEFLISKLSDKVLAEWKRVELLERQSKWNDVIKKLDVITAMNPADAQKCTEHKASIYQHKLYQYKTAIKLYRQADNPPSTLWSIAECQYQLTQLTKAINTLSEIENMFPDCSSRAAWQKVQYYKGANEINKAISAARRIMKMYPKSADSSHAHQFLEDYGIATGGGVL